MTLSAAEAERYSRQLALPEWSPATQERLSAAQAIVVGAGGLGSPAAAHLAAAGVGTLGVVDSEPVRLSSLHGQPLHFTPDVGVNKAESAAAKLAALNPDVTVEPYPVRLDEQNADAIVAGADVVVDCSNDFETRYLVNDACCRAGVALVTGAVGRLSGMTMAIRPRASACYRCAFPAPPPEDAALNGGGDGVLGPVAGVIGSLQALAALEFLAGVGDPPLDAFVRFDGRDLSQLVVAASRRPDCDACGPSESEA